MSGCTTNISPWLLLLLTDGLRIYQPIVFSFLDDWWIYQPFWHHASVVLASVLYSPMLVYLPPHICFWALLPDISVPCASPLCSNKSLSFVNVPQMCRIPDIPATINFFKNNIDDKIIWSKNTLHCICGIRVTTKNMVFQQKSCIPQA